MDDNYPPFVFRDSEGKLEGILVDEWGLWEKHTGIRVEIHALDWSEALQRMRAGEFEVIDTVFKTPERASYWEFSKPYARIDVPVFFRKDISGITGLDSLKGFPVAAKAGDAAADLLKQSGITTALLFTNYEAIIEAARQRKVNVFVMDEPPALYFLNKLGIQDGFRRTAPVNTGEFRRAVKKGDVRLLRAVETGFAALDPTELKQIQEKWHGQVIGGHPNLRYVGYVAVSGLLLISGLMVWNVLLNRLVNRRTEALRRINRTLRMLTECNQVLVRATDETELLQAICRLAVEAGGYRMAWVGLAEPDEARSVRPVAQAGFEAGYLDTVKATWADDERGRGPTGAAIRTGQAVIARNILTDAAFGPWRAAALQRGYAASATLPLKRDEHVLGALMVYAAEPDTFDAAEVELLTQLAGELAYGMTALRTHAEQKVAEQALRQSSEQFRLIMDNLADLVAVLDLRGNRLYNSPSYSHILGDPALLRGSSSFLEVCPEDRPRVEQVFQETVRTGVGQRLEYRMLDQQGQARHLESLGSVIRDEQGRVSKVVVVSRDVTARKRAEEELHRLSAHLLEVQDFERRHLARELHDTTAQHLAALTLNLANLRRTLPPSAEAAQTLCGECLNLANQAALEIRTHSYLLHPPLLDAMGLAGAVEDYTQGFSARSGIAVDLEAPADFGRLPEDTELALFRVIQESLANVLKHSGSRRARIRFTRSASLVTLEVRDMGHGIPADRLARIKARSGGSGVGLGGMQERLRLLGGWLDLESGPKGTTVRATVPLSGPPSEAATKA
jgi:PAS domain S-box-containing protein